MHIYIWMYIYIYMHVYIIYAYVFVYVYIYIYLFISIFRFNTRGGGVENGRSASCHGCFNTTALIWEKWGCKGPPPTLRPLIMKNRLLWKLRPIYSYKTWSFQSYVKLPEGNVGLNVVQTRFVLALVVSTHLNLNQFNIPNHQIWLNIKNNTLTTTDQNATFKLRL